MICVHELALCEDVSEYCRVSEETTFCVWHDGCCYVHLHVIPFSNPEFPGQTFWGCRVSHNTTTHHYESPSDGPRAKAEEGVKQHLRLLAGWRFNLTPVTWRNAYSEDVSEPQSPATSGESRFEFEDGDSVCTSVERATTRTARSCQYESSPSVPVPFQTPIIPGYLSINIGSDGVMHDGSDRRSQSQQSQQDPATHSQNEKSQSDQALMSTAMHPSSSPASPLDTASVTNTSFKKGEGTLSPKHIDAVTRSSKGSDCTKWAKYSAKPSNKNTSKPKKPTTLTGHREATAIANTILVGGVAWAQAPAARTRWEEDLERLKPTTGSQKSASISAALSVYAQATSERSWQATFLCSCALVITHRSEPTEKRVRKLRVNKPRAKKDQSLRDKRLAQFIILLINCLNENVQSDAFNIIPAISASSSWQGLNSIIRELPDKQREIVAKRVTGILLQTEPQAWRAINVRNTFDPAEILSSESLSVVRARTLLGLTARLPCSTTASSPASTWPIPETADSTYSSLPTLASSMPVINDGPWTAASLEAGPVDPGTVIRQQEEREVDMEWRQYSMARESSLDWSQWVADPTVSISDI